MSPYSILVAEVLLKRTTSTAASYVYEDFIRTFPSISVLAKADKQILRSMLKKIGLQSQRTRALTEIAECIAKSYHGDVPSSRKDLESVPHVGPYTAASIRSFGFGIRDAVVDSNVMRVIRRLFAKSFCNRNITLFDYQELATMLLPQEHQTHNFAMLDLGALVCRYDFPRCQTCPLEEICDTSLRRQVVRKHVMH
jgi:A/G-specific adenine glycosylase